VIVLYKMILKTFLPVFAIAVLFFVTILQLVDLYANLTRFLNYNPPVLKILQVVALYTPKCVSYSLPVALLFTVTYVLGTMYVNNELIAIFGSGISIYRLVVPFILIGIAFSVGDYYFENEIVIKTLKQKNELTRALLHERVSQSNYDITVISNGNSVIYHAEYYNDDTQTLTGIEVIEKDSSGYFLSRVNAPSAKWANGVWQFSEAERYYWNEDASSLTDSFSSVYTQENFNEPPDTFRRSAAKIEEMSAADAKKHIENLQRVGLPSLMEETQYYQRFAYALNPMIIVFISMAFSGLFKKNILLMSLLASLVSAVIFFVAQMIASLFAKLGFLTPLAGAMIPTMIFAVAALVSFRLIRT
jgi:lipopolysaccharide export system permease protein